MIIFIINTETIPGLVFTPNEIPKINTLKQRNNKTYQYLLKNTNDALNLWQKHYPNFILHNNIKEKLITGHYTIIYKNIGIKLSNNIFFQNNQVRYLLATSINLHGNDPIVTQDEIQKFLNNYSQNINIFWDDNLISTNKSSTLIYLNDNFEEKSFIDRK